MSIVLALCLGFSVVVLPLVADSLQPLDAYNWARLVQLGTLVMAGLVVLTAPAQVPAGVRWRPMLVVAAAGLLAALAPVPMRALQEIALFASLALLAHLVASNRIELRGIPRLATVATLTYTALALTLAVVAQSTDMGLNVETWLPGVENRRIYNHVQVITLPLVVWDLVRSDGGWRRWAYVALSMSVAVAVLTGARATLLAWISVGVLWTVLVTGRRALIRPLAVALAGGLVVAALVYLEPWVWGLPLNKNAAVYELMRGSEQARLGLWRDALLAWGQAPLQGIGPGHFARGFHHEAAHPHNFYVQLLSEWGLVCAALVGWGMLVLALALIKTYRSTEDEVERRDLVLLLGLGVGLMVDSAVSGNWVMPYSQTWIALAIGILVHHAFPNVARAQGSVIPKWLGLVPIALLLSLVPEFQVLWREGAQIPLGSDAWLMHPRLFLQGHFP